MAAENKTRPTDADVDAYLDSLTDPRRQEDSRRLVPLFRKITGEEPKLWGAGGIIGFGQYHYVYESGREGDSPVAGFAPRKQDLTIYVDGTRHYEGQLARLGKHKTGVCCIYVKKLADIDLGVLEEILTASVARMRAHYGVAPE